MASAYMDTKYGKFLDQPKWIIEKQSSYRPLKRNSTKSSMALVIVPKQKAKVINGYGQKFADIPWDYDFANYYNEGTNTIAHHIAKYNAEPFVYRNTFDGLPKSDGTMPNGIIHTSAEGKYPKSVYDSDMKFDLSDPDLFKKQGGKLNNNLIK